MTIPAMANSFDELNKAYVSSVSQLPAIDDSRLKPDKIEQSSGHIRGWIDIVGFKEVAKVNGTDHINGNPINKTVLRYKIWYEGLRPNRVVYLKKTTQIYSENNNIICELAIELKWYKVVCGETCRRIYTTEKASFYDSEISPIQYPSSSIPQLTLHIFPNLSKALLEVNTDDKITSFKVTTDNGSVIRHIQIGRVVYTAKGVPYANFTDNLPIWNSTGKGVYHQGNDITLDSSNFSFSAKTPFRTVNESNITTIQEQPSSMSMLNVLIFIMLGMGYATCKLAWKAARV